MSREDPDVDWEWEQRKMYLLQCFLGYRDDSTPEREVNAPDASRPPSQINPSDISSRSTSPLPSLIIEREPKRNKHDEPEEHYQELFRRIKKLYEHMILRNGNYSSFDELESQIGYSSSTPSVCEESLSEYQDVQPSIEIEDTASNHESRAKIGSEGAIEDTSLLPELEKRSFEPRVGEVETMRAHRSPTRDPQFSPQQAELLDTVSEESPALAPVMPLRPAPISTTPPVEQPPHCSTPRARKRKAEESGHGPKHRKKTRSEKWSDFYKNFFVGRLRVFSLVERFPEDCQSTSSSEE